MEDMLTKSVCYDDFILRSVTWQQLSVAASFFLEALLIENNNNARLF